MKANWQPGWVKKQERKKKQLAGQAVPNDNDIDFIIPGDYWARVAQAKAKAEQRRQMAKRSKVKRIFKAFKRLIFEILF